MSRTPGRFILTMLGLVASMSIVLAGCCTTLPTPSKELLEAIQACQGEWGSEVKVKLSARIDSLVKGGEVEWKAATKAGGALMDHFTGDSAKTKVYQLYIDCITPAITKYLESDSRPTVVLIGSREDYTGYELTPWAATSVELLHKRLWKALKILPLTVSYGWNDEEIIRAMNPDVIVMHASAFHSDQFKNEAVDKFQALVTSLASLPKAKFLIFSRLPEENPPHDKCERWKRQVQFLTAERFRDRLYFYSLPRKESTFTGKAGIEIAEMVRCLCDLEAAEYSSIYLRDRMKESLERIAGSSCGPVTP
jgi:hypothetical protein